VVQSYSKKNGFLLIENNRGPQLTLQCGINEMLTALKPKGCEEEKIFVFSAQSDRPTSGRILDKVLPQALLTMFVRGISTFLLS